MKVLHVYRTYFPDAPGGLQEAIRQIAYATQAVGVEARIFALSPQPDPHEIALGEGVVVRARSWAAPASCDLGGLDAVRRYRALARWADVVHFHFPWPFGDLLRVFADTGVPAVMTYHSDIVRQKYLGMVYGPLMRKMLSTMSTVVATSPMYAETSAVLTSLVPAKRLQIVPLGIRDYAEKLGIGSDGDEYLANLGLDNEPFFLSLGVLRYYKGLHTLVEAASSTPAKLVIAGSGPETSRLKQLADRLQVNNVIFAGQVSEDEKITLLRRCRGLVLPSHLRSEAFGMVLVEAAMFGKPMICCGIGTGTSFVNEDGVTGFVVSPEAPSALADAINTLRDDEALASTMGSAARARYERLFSAGPLGKAYMKIYQSACESN